MNNEIDIPDPENDPTRQRIIRLAKEKYLRYGFARIPIEELCRDLRMAKKTFYRHFRNRDDLVAAVAVDTMRTFSPRVMAILFSDRPAWEILTEWFDFVAAEMPRHLSPELMSDLEIHTPHIWEQIQKAREMVLNNVGKVVAKGIEEGSIDPAVDPRVFAAVFVAIVNTVGRGSFLREHDIALGNVIALFRRLLISGLRPTPPEEK